MTVVDVDALRSKYAAERAKRLRPDGNDQYLEFTGTFADMLNDPYTERVEREPKRDHVTFAFIGAGFAGLVTGARLKEAGVDDVRIVEKGGDFGGTWYWNRYPGAQCDTASMIYLPLLEETGHMPTELYVHAPEILEHCRRIGKQFGLYENALFHTGSPTWSGTRPRPAGSCGPTAATSSRPSSWAGAPGRCTSPSCRASPASSSFAGHSFHTSRWDYAYTGGDPEGAPMDRLARQARRDHRHRRDRGAVRSAPGRGPARSCSCSSARRRRWTSAPTGRSTRAGSRRSPPGLAAALAGELRRQHVRGGVARRGPGERRLDRPVQADPRARAAELSAATSRPSSEMLDDFENADFEKMSEIRARVDARSSPTRRPRTALKAWYRQLCKRPCFHDEYLRRVQRAVRAPRRHRRAGRRADHRRPGVVAGGVEYPVDCIIYASGFEVGTPPTRRYRLRRDRPRRRPAVGVLGRRDAHPARHPRAPDSRTRSSCSSSQGANFVANVPHNLTDSAANRRRHRGARDPRRAPAGRGDAGRRRTPGCSSWSPIR